MQQVFPCELVSFPHERNLNISALFLDDSYLYTHMYIYIQMASQAYNSIPQGGDDEARLPRERKKPCKQCARRARKDRLVNLMILLNMGILLIAVAVAVILVCFLSGVSSKFPSQSGDTDLPDVVYCKSHIPIFPIPQSYCEITTDIVFVAAPARAAEGFQAVTFDAALDTVNPWKGPPSDDLDRSWEKLMHGKIHLKILIPSQSAD